MVLQRWYPLAGRRVAHDPFDRLLRSFFAPAGAATASAGRAAPLDVRETDEAIVVTASLPGVAPEDIAVTIENRVLSIRAGSAAEDESETGAYLVRERRAGAFSRTLRLPDSVDAEKAVSAYEHGVLAITLPKREEAQARRIEVEVA